MPAARVYVPSATASRFHQDNSLVRAISGPFGSGKSVMCVIELLRRAMSQAPDPRGVRSTRWAVVRSTYGELKTTTIETFMMWMGDYGNITYDSPIRWQSDTNRKLPDGTTLDMQVLFFPLDSPRDTRRLLSLELTGAWLNEARELPGAIIDPLIGRLRGWPRREVDPVSQRVVFAGASWTGVIMDTNPPSERSWFFDRFEKERPRGWQLFRQPPALIKLEDGTYLANHVAENVQNLEGGFDYYFKQLSGSQDYIDVHILGQYGSTYTGKPVFRAYDETLHLAAQDLLPDPRTPIVVGMDFGLTPAAVFTQLDRHGRLLVLGELTPEDILFEDFVDELLIPYINANFSNHPIQIVGDPAGMSRSSLSQRTAFQMLKMRGIAATPAPANDLGSRIDAVNHYLTRNRGLLVAPRCQVFREGMRGGYHFELATGSKELHRDVPAKNFASHVCDAAQYACLHYYRTHLRVARRPRLGPGQTPTQRLPYRYV